MASYVITNAPPLSNMNDFRQAVGRNGDFAKAARFAVQIGRISGLFPDLIFYCETAEMPGRAFDTQDYRYYGPNFKLPHLSAYMDINFSFYVSDKMTEKEMFDKWMAYINPKNTYDFRFLNEYSTDVNIYQFSEVADNDGKPKATYKATLRRAYPINVQPLALSWAEDNIHRLQVTFAYSDWVTEPEKAENSNQLSRISPFTRS